MLRKTKRFSIVIAMMVCLLSGRIVIAQDGSSEGDGNAAKKKVEMLECRVKVLDPDGFPVEEATVFCTGLRSEEERGSHWGWNVEAMGKAPRVETDAEGIAVMPYPKMIAEGQTTAVMTWSVTHPDFVNYREDHSVTDDPAELKLERGFRIALTAVDATTGEKLKDNLHAVTSFQEGGSWELKKNGMFVSGAMKNQNGVMRVACFQQGKPTLFSDEIKIEPGDKSRVLLKSVKLSTGCRIEGKLDDSVVRPVKDGYVIASLVKRPDLKAWNSLWWSDETKIAEDGTFVFESLPKGEAIQMIPICDGFAPKKPKAEDVLAAIPVDNPDRLQGNIDAFTATPQIVKSDGDTVSATLEMKKAFSVTIKVVNKDGEPLENLRVASNPNQYWFNGGSQILGNSYPTRKIWELKKSGKDIMSIYGAIDHPYMERTDENGIACLKNFPEGTYRIGVYEKEWEMQADPISGEREKRVQLRDKDRSITITMFPKGTLPKKEQQSAGEVIMDWWSKLTKQND